MVYNVIGLMSGSSLDGLDIAYTQLTEIAGKWSFEILNADCIKYDSVLSHQLKNARNLSVPEFLNLHTYFGKFIATEVLRFIDAHQLQHKVHFIASHGHTVWHDPANGTSTQIGDGATIAALTALPVISDLRNIDVALGGQGAPIVPIADQLLLADYDFCLNIGGIANVTINDENPLAFDISPANQLLNYFANKAGKDYDAEGMLARSGNVDSTALSAINGLPFYQQIGPKSLDNAFAQEHVLPALESLSAEDGLATATQHIAMQIVAALSPYHNGASTKKLLITGGGAHNTFLVETLTNELDKVNIAVTVPEANVINYKEAIAMALIGTLRWREEQNVLHSVTGATRSSVGGALWLS